MVWLPAGYPLSPTVTANRAPEFASWPSSRVVSGLSPAESVWPQSPNTANEYASGAPAGTWVVNFGEASPPRRSTEPRYTR